MIKIHTKVYGQGAPIVLIHGWAMHSGIWRSFAQELAAQHKVICVDLPGHGLSETVRPYTLEQISSAIIDYLPDTRFSLLGWSLGASVAIRMADLYPQRINSLFLMAGNPRFVQEPEWAGMNVELLDAFSSNLQLNCSLTLFRFLALQVNQLPQGKSLLKQLKQAVEECVPPAEAVLQSGLDILKQADLRENLKALQCPVTVIQGDQDSLVPLQAGLDIKKILPKSDLNIISGAGHVPFLSHQSTVIELINRFI